MEKVKLTQEQADWIEKYTLTQEQVDHLIDIHTHRKRPDSPLVDWRTSKLARALYIGYEVEPQFKVGDWVKLTPNYLVGKITEIDSMGYHTDVHMIAKYEEMRHATDEEIKKEKQRRWWKKHDREVYQFKVNDLITMEDHAVFERIHKVTSDYFETIYGRYFKEEYENIMVSCFVKDRKDIKENDE